VALGVLEPEELPERRQPAGGRSGGDAVGFHGTQIRAEVVGGGRRQRAPARTEPGLRVGQVAAIGLQRVAGRPALGRHHLQETVD